VVIAVIAVGMVEMVADQIVDVVAVRDSRVAAALAVNVVGIVAAAPMIRGVSRRMLLVHGDHVLVDVIRRAGSRRGRRG
jgi:hypothetical protein